jgi:hypothetical protein
MSGIKGKSGLPKGRTNNINGRPLGSKNKIPVPLKNRIVDFVNDDFDILIEEIKKMEVKDRVKSKIELVKLVVPRPLNEEELDANKTQSEFMRRLFGISGRE